MLQSSINTRNLLRSHDVVELQRQTVDLAIRYGRGNYPGLRVCKLMSDMFLPVCSPRLLGGEHPIRKPDDLVHHPLSGFTLEQMPLIGKTGSESPG